MSDNNKLIQWESLPIEIAIDIFLRLPIKSIIICTSVSQSWKSQIQNPTFISTHPNFPTTKTKTSSSSASTHTLTKSPTHCRTKMNLNSPNTPAWLPFPCSIPSVSKRNIPCGGYFTQCLPYTRFGTFIGFGFDPKTNDYKVIRVVLNLRSRFIHCPLLNGERLWLVWLSYVLHVVVSHKHLSMELCIELLAEYMMTDFNVLFWRSIWVTRSSVKYCCRLNFQIPVSCLLYLSLFLYMGIPSPIVILVDMGMIVIISFYGLWNSMVLHRNGHHFILLMEFSEWPYHGQ